MRVLNFGAPNTIMERTNLYAKIKIGLNFVRTLKGTLKVEARQTSIELRKW